VRSSTQTLWGEASSTVTAVKAGEHPCGAAVPVPVSWRAPAKAKIHTPVLLFLLLLLLH